MVSRSAGTCAWRFAAEARIDQPGRLSPHDPGAFHHSSWTSPGDPDRRTGAPAGRESARDASAPNPDVISWRGGATPAEPTDGRGGADDLRGDVGAPGRDRVGQPGAGAPPPRPAPRPPA